MLYIFKPVQMQVSAVFIQRMCLLTSRSQELVANNSKSWSSFSVKLGLVSPLDRIISSYGLCKSRCAS